MPTPLKRASMPPAALLEARDLVLVARETGAVLVNGVSLTLNPHEILALVGESGSGKSLTALSLLGLLPQGVEHRGGQILLDGVDVTGFAGAHQYLRGQTIAAIFQDPQASLDPRWSVGRYLIDRFARLRRMDAKAAHAAAVDMLEQVGLANPLRIMRAFPHELSGGMAQRVMIAGALAGEPRILIADEPTTALDVTTQAQILDLIEDIQRRTGLGLLIITHDLGVVAELAHRMMVLYGGRVMEEGDAGMVLTRPLHPYTGALLASMPDLASDVPPDPIPAASAGWQSQGGCPFAPRCSRVLAVCATIVPPVTFAEEGRAYACHAREPKTPLPEERRLHAYS